MLTNFFYAADVVLAHGLVNGNKPLIDELINRGVSLTFDHLKIAAKVSYSSSLMIEHDVDFVRSTARLLASQLASRSHQERRSIQGFL